MATFTNADEERSEEPMAGSVCRTRCTSLALGLGVVAAVLLVACGGTADSGEVEALRAYQEAVDLEEKGNLLKAGEGYTRAIRLNPELADAYVRRGYIFYSHNSLPSAFEDLITATELDPNLAIAYNYLGLVYAAQGDSDAAIVSLSKALDLDPQLAEAFYNRAMVSYKQGDLDAATGDMSDLIALEPREPRYYMERAQLYLMSGESGKAVADLEQVLAMTRDEGLVLAAKQLLAAASRVEAR